tara:strand:+ start:16 stop:723 length:708 start_codon:yes stop_codon:yes gene_type:complete
MSETNLDGSEAAPAAAHILGDAPTEGAEAQAVTAGAGHGHQEPNASPEDTTSWSDLGTDDLHGDVVVVAPPATTTQPAPALSELAAERDALRERLLAVTAERDELRPRLPAEYVVVRADEALRTVSVLRRYGSFTAAQDLRLRLGAFDDTDWLVAGLAAERDPDAPARYCGTVFRDEYIYLDVRPPAEDDDASELTADDDTELAVQDDWPGDVVGAAALVLLAAVLAGCAVARRR